MTMDFSVFVSTLAVGMLAFLGVFAIGLALLDGTSLGHWLTDAHNAVVPLSVVVSAALMLVALLRAT